MPRSYSKDNTKIQFELLDCNSQLYTNPLTVTLSMGRVVDLPRATLEAPPGSGANCHYGVVDLVLVNTAA